MIEFFFVWLICACQRRPPIPVPECFLEKEVFYETAAPDVVSNSPKIFLGNGTAGTYRGTAGILQLCNTARHNVVILYVPIYHAFY